MICGDEQRIQNIEEALRDAPAREIDLSVVRRIVDVHRALDEGGHDVVLIDLIGGNDETLLHSDTITRLRRLYHHIPIVAITAECSPDVILRGAQDYVTAEQIHPVTLQRVIENAVLRHALTDQLRHANRLLDRRGAELKQTNDTLHKKNDLLKAQWDDAQEFLDHISHEFRTPLTVIREYATILADGLVGPVSAKQQEFLEIIDSRTDDLGQLIDDLLEVSRLRAGVLEVHRRDCTVADILDRVRGTLEGKAAKHDVSLSFSVQDTLPRVHCDPEKIGRALVTIAAIAMKGCDEGESLEVWAQAGDASGQIVLGVTNPNRELPVAENGKTYEVLCRDDLKGIKSGDGLACDLGIVQDLVALNFGHLKVESSPGRGTVLSFSLPSSNAKGLVTRYFEMLESLDEQPLPVSVVSLQAAANLDKRRREDLDRFLQGKTGPRDFVLRVAADRWLAFVQCKESEIAHVTQCWSEDWAEFTGSVRGGLADFQLQHRGTWILPDATSDLTQQLRPDYLTSARNASESCVLVVDDDRDFANGLHLQLGAAGYAAKTAKDAETALRMAAQLHPQAILLDHGLPGMNGMDALDELKRNPTTQSIPVIMLSANTKLQQTALARNASFYLKKPCGFENIVSALRNVLA